MLGEIDGGLKYFCKGAAMMGLSAPVSQSMQCLH